VADRRLDDVQGTVRLLRGAVERGDHRRVRELLTAAVDAMVAV
jgi:hypothetical protein